jgi:hypothetical protein
MSEREIAELAEFLIGRAQHLVKLAAVTDARTWLRYLAAVHYEVRPRLDRFAAASRDEEPQRLPN